MLRYAKALSVISVEDKAMPRHVLRRLAVALLVRQACVERVPRPCPFSGILPWAFYTM